MKQVFALLIAALFAAAALSQNAPAGNAHPDAMLLAEQEGGFINPFGVPAAHSSSSPDDKHAFAEQLDLSPLQSAAVFHNGRVKTFGTLARETVFQISGKRKYDEPSSPNEKGKSEKLKYNPVFTLLDLAIDPAYYSDKPLIAVDFLPARRAFLDAAFADDPYAAERWTRYGRISPLMAVQLGGEIFTKNESIPAFRESVGRIDRRLGFYQNTINNFAMVAPESLDDKWHHLGEWGGDTELGAVSAKLGVAWRAQDAAAVNAAIIEIAALLPTINTAQYPTSKLKVESLYNKLAAFEWGLWLYGFAFVTLMLAFGTGRKWIIMLGAVLLMAAIVMHATGFTLRCIVADRFAIQNQFESMTGLSLFAAIVGLAIMALKKQWLFGAATACVGFLVLITATQTGVPGRDIQNEAAILNTSVLLKYHVTTVLASYGLISLGFVVSLFYLGTHYAAKMRGGGGMLCWRPTRSASKKASRPACSGHLPTCTRLR